MGCACGAGPSATIPLPALPTRPAWKATAVLAVPVPRLLSSTPSFSASRRSANTAMKDAPRESPTVSGVGWGARRGRQINS